VAIGRPTGLAAARHLVKYVATIGGTSEVVEITGGDGHYRLTIGERQWEVDGQATAAGIYSLLMSSSRGDPLPLHSNTSGSCLQDWRYVT
jgi:hypothetical protein